MDERRAYALYQESAEEGGNPHGMFALGMCLLHGTGTGEKGTSLKEARHWLKKSADAGLAVARDKLKEVEAAAQGQVDAQAADMLTGHKTGHKEHQQHQHQQQQQQNCLTLDDDSD